MRQIHTKHCCDPASLQEHRATRPTGVHGQGGGSKSMDDHLTVERLLTDGMEAEPGKTGQVESRPRVDF